MVYGGSASDVEVWEDEAMVFREEAVSLVAAALF
jgi:hypothetical protein